MLSPIHFTLETDVEVSFSKVRSIPTMVGVSANIVALVEYYKNAIGVNLPRRKAKVLDCIF